MDGFLSFELCVCVCVWVELVDWEQKRQYVVLREREKGSWRICAVILLKIPPDTSWSVSLLISVKIMVLPKFFCSINEVFFLFATCAAAAMGLRKPMGSAEDWSSSSSCWLSVLDWSSFGTRMAGSIFLDISMAMIFSLSYYRIPVSRHDELLSPSVSPNR